MKDTLQQLQDAVQVTKVCSCTETFYLFNGLFTTWYFCWASRSIIIIVFDFSFQTNIVRYNEENLVKIDESMHESLRNQLSNVLSKDTSITTGHEYGGPFSLSSKSRDLEMPMPPLTLAPLLSQDIRYTLVFFLLSLGFPRSYI
jgi:hypothetical protein